MVATVPLYDTIRRFSERGLPTPTFPQGDDDDQNYIRLGKFWAVRLENTHILCLYYITADDAGECWTQQCSFSRLGLTQRSFEFKLWCMLHHTMFSDPPPHIDPMSLAPITNLSSSTIRKPKS